MVKEALALASVFCATNEDLAKYWGVNPSTVGRWMKRYPDLCKALENAKQSAKASLQSTLFRNAQGKWDEKNAMFAQAPNMTALIFLLTNKFPEEWRDRRAVVNNTVVTSISNGGNPKFPEEDISLQRQIKQDFMDRLK
jgi:hypothetical protein